MEISNFLTQSILPRPKTVWAITLGITAIAVAILINTPPPATLLESFVADPAKYAAYRARVEELGGNTDSLIYFAMEEGPSLFTPEKLNAIRAAAEELKALPEVQSVIALTDLRNVHSEEEPSIGLLSRRVLIHQLQQGKVPEDVPPAPYFWPISPEKQQQVDLGELRRVMLADEGIRKTFLSTEGESHLMIIEIADAHLLNGYLQYTIREELQEILLKHGLGEQGIFSGGVIVGEGWLFYEMLRSVKLLLPIGALLISFIVYSIFHRLSLVWLTLFVGFCSTMIGVATNSLIYGQTSILVTAVPLLVLIISSSDIIHLASAYTVATDHGHSHEDALKKMSSEVSDACFLTSATTAIGLFSLIFVPIATMKHFAVASSVGVGSALVLAVIFTPLMLHRYPVVSAHVHRPPNIFSRTVRWVLRLCQYLSVQHPRLVVLGSLVLIGLATYACMGHPWRSDFVARFPKDHPIQTGVDYLNTHFTGAHSIEIFLVDDTGQLTEPEMLAAIDRYEQAVRKIDGVIQTHSVMRLFQVGDELIGFDPETGLPSTSTEAVTYLRLIEEVSQQDTTSLMKSNGKLMRIIVNIESTSYLRVNEISERVEELAREILPARIELEITGSFATLGIANQKIISSLLGSFVVCFLTVMVVLTWGVGSVRLGAISVLPNLFPLMLLLGSIALWSDSFDNDLIIVFIIGFGIAVDDTIHFVHRFQLEYEQTGNVQTAVENAFRFTGQAIVRTTIILAIGLLPFSLGNYLTIQMFGTLLGLLLIFAIIGDLLLLPALLILFASRKPPVGKLPANSSAPTSEPQSLPL